eukprot:15475184-Alexandrium_andersonii.AAC.1
MHKRLAFTAVAASLLMPINACVLLLYAALGSAGRFQGVSGALSHRLRMLEKPELPKQLPKAAESRIM